MHAPIALGPDQYSTELGGELGREEIDPEVSFCYATPAFTFTQIQSAHLIQAHTYIEDDPVSN